MDGTDAKACKRIRSVCFTELEAHLGKYFVPETYEE